MKTYTLCVAILLLAIINPTISLADEIEFKSLTIDQALKTALIQDKNIFVSFGADWCLPCQMMEESIFSDEKVIAILNDDFVSIKANYDDINNHDWFSSYDVSCLPTTSVINDSGTEVDKLEGTTDIRMFLSFLYKNNKRSKAVAASKATVEPIKNTVASKVPTGDYVKLPSGATTTRASYDLQFPSNGSIVNQEPKVQKTEVKEFIAEEVIIEKKEVTIVKNAPVIPPSNAQTASAEVKFTVVQFGAFSRYDNAVKLREKISAILDVPIVIHEDTKNIFKVMHADDITADSFSMLISKAKRNSLDFYVKN